MMTLFLAAAVAGGDLIHDFSKEDAARFSCVNDTVMGGRSSATLEPLPDGVLRFAGDLSLENNGGFTSFRSRDTTYQLAEGDGLSVRVKGDGRTYTFSLDIAGTRLAAGGYWQEFATKDGVWQDVFLPFDGFVPTSFGRSLSGLSPATAERIEGMAVYLVDKQDGPFSVEFDSIALSREDAPSSNPNDDAGLLPQNCSTLSSLLEKTGLDVAVSELDGFTLFAPTDEAFGALPADVVDALLRPENVDALKKVLLHHVIAAPVTAWNAAGLDSGTVLDGGSVSIERDGSGLRVGGALVVAADRLRGRGVIHVVDSVLVPDDLELAAAPAAAARGSATSVFSAAISRGVPLFNEGNPEACAATYRTAVEAVIAFEPGDVTPDMIDFLRTALAKSEREDDRMAAWTLRRAMDVAIVAG